uniref:Bone morphogenetic protein 2-B-like n=1 Tax=Fundulus heteroclitus TaxID=8078 RepID=A0A3Q2QUJ8_FUNHE
MPAGALRLCLLLAALHLRSVPGAALDEAPFELKDLPRAPVFSPHRKAPQFMLDLFSFVSMADEARKSQKEVLEGNTVRSFQDKGPTGERIHFFNLSSLGREEKMIKAEFRWFRKKQKFYLGMSHFYKVDVYEVLDSRVKPPRGNLITSRLVPLYTQGWEVFNVTQTVSKWMQNSQENNGILVVTTFPSSDWIKSASKHPEWTDTSAYLVIFSDDGRPEANQSHQGKLMWSGICVCHQPETFHLCLNNYIPFPTGQPAAAAAPEPQHRLSRRRRASSDFPHRGRPQSCRRVPLFVDFEEIGWSGWVISPRGYNAYRCKGSCPFPLGVGLRATNHATVRSIMHALKLPGEEVGAPCCVPDRLQSISLLYFDEEENVVLKQFDDMVALSCGCH